MGRAEVGTPKYIANKMKSKGLQRLRWYCQVCSKQCRDENGFKCHTQSPSHINNITSLSISGSNKNNEIIESYSSNFLKDFIYLLRTRHGEKKINVNRFYQEFISDKDHIHMNSTKWTSLTVFTKYLQNENICNVIENENEGLCISWIDNSPESIEKKLYLKRQEKNKINKVKQQEKILNEDIKRFKKNIGDDTTIIIPDKERILKRDGNEVIKLSLSFGNNNTNSDSKKITKTPQNGQKGVELETASETATIPQSTSLPSSSTSSSSTTETKKISFGFNKDKSTTKPKNIFKTALNNNTKKNNNNSKNSSNSGKRSVISQLMEKQRSTKKQRV